MQRADTAARDARSPRAELERLVARGVPTDDEPGAAATSARARLLSLAPCVSGIG
jgi:hypothetical protein